MVQTDSGPRLIPETVTARARQGRRWDVGFGLRFYIALLVGLVWIGPAWWDVRFLCALAAWDVLLALAWWNDLRRLPLPSELEVERSWSQALTQAAWCRIHLRVRSKPYAGLQLVLVDDLPMSIEVSAVDGLSKSVATNGEALVAEPPRLQSVLGVGGTAASEYWVRPTERGDCTLGGVFLRYQGRLQLAERRAFASLQQTVRVYPNLDEVRRHAFYLMRSRQVVLEKRFRRQPGVGGEFESLREHREGDEPKDICWSATARRGKLISKAYRIEGSQTVWIVIDSGRLMLARVQPATPLQDSSVAAGGSVGFRPGRSKIPLTKLDYAISAALGLAQVALLSGDRVGLLAYGRKHQTRLPAARGTLHLRSMLEVLATVRGELSEADHARAADLLLAGQRRRSLVVWLTDLAETAATPEVIESATRFLRQHLVLFVAVTPIDLIEFCARRPESEEEMYRYVAAQEVLERRDLLLRKLREQGALALELTPGRLATALVNRYLEVKERSLL